VIIPRTKKYRDNTIDEIAELCLGSKRDREELYLMRKRYFHFGTADYNIECKYNRLQAHLDLVSSFLFAPDHCRYNIAAPRNAADAIIEQIEAVADEWNDTFRDSGLADLFADSVLWALILDSTIIKLGWNDAREELFGKMIFPSDFAVYDETEPDLDSQEAFVHTYSLNWDNAVQRLKRAGKIKEIKQLARYPGQYSEFRDQMPPVLANMLISQTGGPNLAGAMVGRVNVDFQAYATYQSESNNPMVRFHEVWVWDDDTDDYAIFTKADGVDGVLSDSRETIDAMRKADEARASELYRGSSNLFGIEQEHPFVHVCPYRLHDFFWGKAHLDILIPLQVWTNERLQQIADLLEQNVDPTKIGSGFMGLTDEKMDALGGAGSFVYDMIPGAKVEFERPPVVPDLFAEFKEIGTIFLEASGLTETIMGRGEQGIRSEKQGKRAVATGSGRLRKVAVGLEAPLVKIGDVGLKLLQRNSKERLITDSGALMVPAQLAEQKIKMRVSGHSHSPLFADEAKEMAAGLFKTQAIDRFSLLDMTDPPNKDELKHRLKKRVAAEKQEKQQQAAAPTKPSRPRAAA